MKLLDLFTGTGSVRVVAEALGYEVTSLDIDPRCNPDFVVDITKGNEKGSFMSNLLHKHEDDIITRCIPALKFINIGVTTLCFDGLLTLGNMYDTPQGETVLKTLTGVSDSLGYQLKWAMKPHPTVELPDTPTPEEHTRDLKETDYADIFIDDNQDTLFVAGNNSAYTINTFGIYTLITKPKQYIKKKLINDDYKNHKYLQNDSHLNSVTSIIYTMLYRQHNIRLEYLCR